MRMRSRVRNLCTRPSVEMLEDRWVPSTFTVNRITPDDIGVAGTLRWAVAQANSTAGADTIDFDKTVFQTAQTITLGGSQLELSDTAGATTITGPAAGVTVSGNNASRVLQVDQMVTASVSGLTITGGHPGGRSAGGAGVNSSGTLALIDCTISGNATGTAGHGGGVNNSGSLTMSNCTVSNNSAYSGCGLYNGNGFGGDTTATLTGCTVSGNSSTSSSGGLASGGGVFNAPSCTLTMTSCTVSGNSAVFGGGVYNFSAAATLTNCTVSGNTADVGGGGVFNYSQGTATLTNCTVSGNSTLHPGIFGGGGGVYNGYSTLTMTNCTVSGNIDNSTGGGGVCNSFRSTATLTNCTVSGNSTSYSYLGDGGGLLNYSQSTATLTNCTVSGNSASGNGGGVWNFRGFLYHSESTATLTNCTVSGNSASYNGGGVYNYASTARLINCTVSGNSAGAGGGLDTVIPSPGLPFNTTATLTNTIVAGQTAGGDVAGTVSGSNNLIGTGGSGGLVNGVNGNQVGVANVLLAPLGNYGGPTQTMPLLPGSPAIDAGTSSGAPALDQRGQPRLGAVDVGAFESQGFTLAVVSGSPQSAYVNTAFALPLVVRVTANNPAEPVDHGQVTFTAPGSGPSATLNSSPATLSGGQASVTATAVGAAGSYAVVAGTAGAAGTVSFSLTNRTLTVVGPVSYLAGVDSRLTPAQAGAGTLLAGANLGTGQKSVIRYLQVTFSSQVYLDPNGNCGLDLIEVNGPAFNTGNTTGGRLIHASVYSTSINPQTGAETVTCSFSGAGTENGSLEDGNYSLSFNESAIHAGGAGGPALFTAGDPFATRAAQFHRLFGDSNGDGKVDGVDSAAFLAAYRSVVGQANYRAYFDFSNHARVDSTDYYELLRRNNKRLNADGSYASI